MGCQAGNWRAFESLRIPVRGLLETEELPRMCVCVGGSLCLENRSYGTLCLYPIGVGASVHPQQMGRPTGSRGSPEDLLTDRK